MHKKLYSLVISGIIVVNTACSAGQGHANIIDIEKEIKPVKVLSPEISILLFFKFTVKIRIVKI